MGAPSVMHRDPERVALVIPVVIMGMVGGLERVRGAKREGSRMRECIATKRCASCGADASVTCHLLRFLLAPVLRGPPLSRPPALPEDTGVS